MQWRMLLAIALSFLVFYLYQVLFVPTKPIKRKGEESRVAQKQTTLQEKGGSPLKELKMPVQRPALPYRAQSGRIITVSTPLYIVQFSEKGAAIRSFRLKKYREYLEGNSPLKEVVHAQNKDVRSVGIDFLEKSISGLDRAVFMANTEKTRIEAREERKQLVFSWESPEHGVNILKKFTFHPKSYIIDLEVKVRNFSRKTIQDNLIVVLRKSLRSGQKSTYVFTGPAALIDGRLEEIKIKDKNPGTEKAYSGVITWTGFKDRYFMSALIPDKAQKAGIRLLAQAKDILELNYISPATSIPAMNEQSYLFHLYFGPQSLETLTKIGFSLAKAINFGWFDIIAKPLLHFMIIMNRIFKNYGLTIIVITILIKILFWPLSNKSYQSMHQMKKLQPRIAEIREKYKHDKKLMNQEMMNLYRVYKVNPLAGCLPMILQIPIFFALYKVLYQAIELRHAPFVWWINDLSAPDRLFRFNFAIPFMQPPYGIPVLTIIMGASMFLQQKMSPPPGDPTQAKVMMFMPLFFTVIFINFPSGLVLYWLVNNILSIAQQYYVNKRFV